MTKKVYCLFCASRCGAILETQNGRIIKVKGDPEHPVSLGWMCSRGKAAVARRLASQDYPKYNTNR